MTECDVCMHRCRLEEGRTGLCRARKCIDGEIKSINYGQLTAMALDPIEKKPLVMYMPGSYVLSVGSFGCNLRCPFCQNYEISMAGAGSSAGAETRADGAEDDAPAAETVYVSPQTLAEKAEVLKGEGNIGVAFTYNEPLICPEYVCDTGSLIHEKGMKNVIVTNGSVTKETAAKILPFADAVNIDLKAWSPGFYKKVGGDLQTVRDFIALAADNCHVEITTLIVPGENDAPHEMDGLSQWIASLDENIPLHVTRFFPRYKMSDRRATDVKAVYALAERARLNLRHVFEGNC